MITEIFVVRRKYLVVYFNFFNCFFTEEVYLLYSNKQGMQKQIFEWLNTRMGQHDMSEIVVGDAEHLRYQSGMQYI